MCNLSKGGQLQKEDICAGQTLVCLCLYVCVRGPQPQGTNNLKNKSAISFSRAADSICYVFLLSFLLLQAADCTMKLWSLTTLVAFPNSRTPSACFTTLLRSCCSGYSVLHFVSSTSQCYMFMQL